MSSDRDQLIKQMFVDASNRVGEERERFLRDNCGGDSDLHSAVERLLNADDVVATSFLAGQSWSYSEARTPARIGPFSIVRKVGEGGMGMVFEAEQDHPRRKVALKMVRHAGLSMPLRRRFEHEVQVLGQLKHRGIAQIYEAGMHDLGTGPVPYFAMEYVHGRPLLEFAAAHQLDAGQRLELTCKICDAVHHAHQKGVVHRDLKPANILVEEADPAEAQPKILDFGIARITRSDVQLVTMHTEVGQLIGTLSYMSPEQVAGNPDELDERSDVYALGVIMYELLAGRLPYDLRDASIPEAATIIREQEPSRLSSIDAGFRGDIETIVAKALAKEKDRRYQSAAELSADIRRFLIDEPIVARPASRAYQLRKFAKRNKGLVGGVAAAFAVLLIAVVGISFALVRARRAEHAAWQSAARANAVSSFLQNMLAGVDPEAVGPGALTVREVLDQAGARVEHELAAEPEVAASVHQTLGEHYSTLGHYVDADRHLRRAVELRKALVAGDDPQMADALISLAANLQDQRDLAEAEGVMRAALEMRRRMFGHASPEVAETLHGMAYILIEQKRAQEAEPLVRQALEIEQRLGRSEQIAVATSTLGWCLMDSGKLEDAEAAMLDAVERVRRLPGDNEIALAGRLTFLSAVLRARGKDVEVEAAVREAIAIRSRRLSPDHPALGWNLFCLAQARLRQGGLDEAEIACRKALDIFLKMRGPEHGDIASCHQVLAQIYDHRGGFAEAEPWWKSCLEMRRKLLPPGHPEISSAEKGLLDNKASQDAILKSVTVEP